MIMTALLIILGVLMVAAAIMAIYAKSLLTSIIAVGILSLFASVLYLVLAAPDVAMTEASIGAGLSTVIFLYALSKTTGREEDDD